MPILDHFSIFLTVAEYGILGDLLAFLIQSQSDFYETWRTTMVTTKPQHFGRDLADIQIWNNLAIQIRIPDHFLLKF